jgi:hypothetical protein
MIIETALLQSSVAAINKALKELSSRARTQIHTAAIVTDDVRALSPARGEAVATPLPATQEELTGTRNAVLDVIARLKQQCEVVMKAREGSEKRAELLLIVGGIIILALPVVSIIANVRGVNIGWVTNLLNGLTAVGFMALMFGPGREIRRAAKDRTILLLIPIGFEARVVAASTFEELRAIASDLQTTIGSLAPQE